MLQINKVDLKTWAYTCAFFKGSVIKAKKNICLLKLSYQNKIRSVGRKIFLFFKIFF